MTPAATTATPTTSPKGTVSIAKSAKGQLKATVGSKARLELLVATTDAPTGDFRVRIGGFDGTLKARLTANGKLVIRIPELARAGKRTLKVTYLGDDTHPRTTRKFVLRVLG